MSTNTALWYPSTVLVYHSAVLVLTSCKNTGEIVLSAVRASFLFFCESFENTRENLARRWRGGGAELARFSTLLFLVFCCNVPVFRQMTKYKYLFVGHPRSTAGLALGHACSRTRPTPGIRFIYMPIPANENSTTFTAKRNQGHGTLSSKPPPR